MLSFPLSLALLFVYMPVFCSAAASGCGIGVAPARNGKIDALIRKIKRAQESIRTISYTTERADTLVTGDTRVLKGKALIRADRKDSLFGFEFEARMEGVHGAIVYGGRVIYETDDEQKVYTVITDPALLSHALWQHGGQIILPDLVRLDTSGAVGFESWQDGAFLYLRMHYPDLTQYDVSKRSKTLTIDPVSFLPVAMRSHQETLGKVQDLYYTLKDIRLNDPGFDYDFSSPVFLANYTQHILEPSPPLQKLEGQDAPGFVLTGFEKQEVSLTGLRGKPVLLDFWEVWCGACIESMPKVEHLYEKYKDKGLQVFGVINETKQLEPSRLLVQKRGIRFPMLIGNEQFKKDYRVGAIPLYVLIDGSGKVVYVSLGYSPGLEAAIEKVIPRD